jgi:hypothetical protein
MSFGRGARGGPGRMPDQPDRRERCSALARSHDRVWHPHQPQFDVGRNQPDVLPRCGVERRHAPKKLKFCPLESATRPRTRANSTSTSVLPGQGRSTGSATHLASNRLLWVMRGKSHAKQNASVLHPATEVALSASCRSSQLSMRPGLAPTARDYARREGRFQRAAFARNKPQSLGETGSAAAWAS